MALDLKGDAKPQQREEEFLVQEPKTFGGHAFKLVLKHYPTWTEVFMEWDHEPKWKIAGVPLDVLERIVELAYARRRLEK